MFIEYLFFHIPYEKISHCRLMLNNAISNIPDGVFKGLTSFAELRVSPRKHKLDMFVLCPNEHNFDFTLIS